MKAGTLWALALEAKTRRIPKKENRREWLRASDEVIVSDDPRWDSITHWRAKGLWIGRFAEFDGGLHTEGGNRVIGRSGLRSCISNPCGLRRSRQESRFEAVLGKTRRTEF